MDIDRVANWKKFSEHMEDYIQTETICKYGFGDRKKEGCTFDLMSVTDPIVCVWNILRYSLRLWKGMGKDHDLEKIAHYAEIAWTMDRERESDSR